MKVNLSLGLIPVHWRRIGSVDIYLHMSLTLGGLQNRCEYGSGKKICVKVMWFFRHFVFLVTSSDKKRTAHISWQEGNLVHASNNISHMPCICLVVFDFLWTWYVCYCKQVDLPNLFRAILTLLSAVSVFFVCLTCVLLLCILCRVKTWFE